jgi:PAS domain S-box-containing protein
MRPPPTIFRRLLAFVLVATLPLVTVIGYALLQQFQADRARAMDELQLLREVNARRLATYLADTQQKLKALAQSDAMADFHQPEAVRLFRQFVAFNPEFSNVGFLDQQGHVLATANLHPLSPQTSLLQYPQYHAAITLDSFQISHPYIRDVVNEWTCLLSYPVSRADGVRLGTIVAPMNLPQFARSLNIAPSIHGSSVCVIDVISGTTVMRLPDADAFIGRQVPHFHELMADFKAAAPAAISYQGRDGRPRKVSATMLPGTPWMVCATVPTAGILHAAWLNFWRTLGGLVVFLVAVLVLIWRYALTIERPISALASAARRQAALPVAPEAPREISETIAAFNAMLAARHQAEASLAQCEHRYRTVIDQTGQMIYDYDVPTGTVTWFGGTAIRLITGYAMEEYNRLGVAGWRDHLHPEDRDTAVQRLENCLRTGRPCHAEYRLRHRDGSYRFIEERGVVLADSQGVSTRMLGCMVDITPRRAADQALRDTKVWLQSIIDTIDGIVWEVEIATMQFTFVSPQAARILGFPARQWLEEKDFWTNHMHPDDCRWAPDYCLAATRKKLDHDFEYRMVAADGRVVWLHDVVSIVRENDRATRLRGVMVDITGRKQAEAERGRLERKLLETQKLERLGVLAGGIAHDFNNLLTTILGHASLAQLQLDAPAPGRGALVQIEKAALRAADLCKQMLAYAGKGRLTTEAIDLNALIEDITRLLEVSTQKRAAILNILERPLPAINADASQLRQVIMNLVINASESMPGREGTITLTTGLIEASETSLLADHYLVECAPGPYVSLEVADNGDGMDHATLGRIFDPFFTTKPTGSGLGLAAVIGIVRSHQGTIKVTSTPGRGTTFKVLLPAVSAPVAEPKPAAPASRNWPDGGTVLVVDDEPAVRLVLRQALEHFGFTVDEAADGLAAVELFQAGAPGYAVVFLDLTMPRMNGLEAFARLRQIAPGLRVILMSGFNKADATTRFPDQAFSDFIQKPFNIEALVQALNRALDS